MDQLHSPDGNLFLSLTLCLTKKRTALSCADEWALHESLHVLSVTLYKGSLQRSVDQRDNARNNLKPGRFCVLDSIRIKSKGIAYFIHRVTDGVLHKTWRQKQQAAERIILYYSGDELQAALWSLWRHMLFDKLSFTLLTEICISVIRWPDDKSDHSPY